MRLACIVALSILPLVARAQAPAPDVDTLIDQLGHSSFDAREAATQALRALGALVLPRLAPHADDQSLERRTRARALLDRIPVDALLSKISGAPRELADAFAQADPRERSARLRLLLLETRPTVAFPILLEVARLDPAGPIGRTALEGLARLAAPSMEASLDARGSMRGDTAGDGSCADALRYAVSAFRITPAEAARLEATARPEPVAGGLPATQLLLLAVLAESWRFAFALDPVNQEVVVMGPREAVAHWDEWYANAGPASLAWSEFLRDDAQREPSAPGPDQIDAWVARLMGPDGIDRRRAADALGRCPAAEPALEAAFARAQPAQREALAEPLARTRLGKVGFAVVERLCADATLLQLFRQPLDGGPARALTHGSSSAYEARVAPGGRWISYTCGHERVVIDADGGARWRSTGEMSSDCRTRWSPDGEWLYYEVAPNCDSPRELHRIHIGTGRDQLLGVVRPTAEGFAPFPVLSPDGRHAAYLVDEGTTRVAVVNEVGGATRRLAAEIAAIEQLVWLDDATVLVVDREPATGAPRVHRFGIDGAARGSPIALLVEGQRAPITTVGENPRITVAPDRLSLLVATQDGQRSVVGLTDSPVVVPLGPGGNAQARWSPDGSRLAMVVAREVRVYGRDGQSLPIPPLVFADAPFRTSQALWTTGWGAREMLWVLEQRTVCAWPPAFDAILHVQAGETWAARARLPGGAQIAGMSPDGGWLFLVDKGLGNQGLQAVSLVNGLVLRISDRPGVDVRAAVYCSR